jgi:hypothetical protein
MDTILHDVARRVAAEASRLARANHRQVITTRELESAVRNVFPSILCEA